MATQPPLDVPPEFDGLSKEEQIEFVRALWNRIASDESEVPVPEWHLQIVRERLAKLDVEDELWGEICDRLSKRHDG